MSDNDTRPTRATMTVPEAGELLGLSRRSAYRAAAGGHIPVIRIGHRMLVPTAKVYDMLGWGPVPAPVRDPGA